MARNKKNTNTGLRWVCGDCASNDERKVVATITAKYAGTCKLGGEHIAPGQQVFALDAGVRKSKTTLEKAPPPQPSLMPMDLKEAVQAYELWLAGHGGVLEPGVAMRVLDAAREQLRAQENQKSSIE